MSTKTAIIRQSEQDFNAISVNVAESFEDFDNGGSFDAEGWTDSTAHTFTEPDEDGACDVADFDPQVWLADIDACLATMGYTRVGDLASESDFVQTCTVVKVAA